MAAVGLAIVGRNNAPLYVREFLSEIGPEETDDEAVLFGLKSKATAPDNTDSTLAASSKCWFALHAALDRMDQLTQTVDGKAKTLEGNGKFVGFLLPWEETRIYGYQTKTHTKILVLVEEEGPNLAEPTEAAAKELLEEIHELYIREIMNPFHQLGTSSSTTSNASNQLSKQFDQHIQKHIANYNQLEMPQYSTTGSAEC